MRPSRKLHQFPFLLWHSLDVWKYYISYTDPNLLLRGLLKTMRRCPVLQKQPLPTLGVSMAGKSLLLPAVCLCNMSFQRGRSCPQNLTVCSHHQQSHAICRMDCESLLCFTWALGFNGEGEGGAGYGGWSCSSCWETRASSYFHHMEAFCPGNSIAISKPEVYLAIVPRPFQPLQFSLAGAAPQQLFLCGGHCRRSWVFSSPTSKLASQVTESCWQELCY